MTDTRSTPPRDGCWSTANVKQWIEDSAHLHMVAHKNPDMGLSPSPSAQARCQACGLWANEYGFYAAVLICGRCVRKAFPAGRTMTTAEIDGWYDHFRRHFAVVPECDLARFKTICDMAKAASVAQSESERIVWKAGEPRVVCAALRDAAGRLVTGARHFDQVMLEQIKRGPDTDAWRGAEQGFIDQHGKFLTREEAMVIATKWGQIIRDDEGRQSLFSENLY